MAGLRRLPNRPGGKYYARITMPTSQGERLVGLNTDSKVTARYRKGIVEEVEAEIKDGKDLVFDWQSTNPEVSYFKLSLEKATEDFLRARKADGLRVSTLEIYRLGLSRFKKAAKGSADVKQITLKTIDVFKERFIHLKPATVNMNLRTIKVFMIWLKDRNCIESVPKIKMVKVDNGLPVYLSNSEFKEVCKRVDPHFQRAFWFYRETGLRLSEPFNGEIDGDFFTIKAIDYKGHKDHTIFLIPELKQVLMEMKSMFEEKVKHKIATKKCAIHLYSEVFHKACKGNKRKGIEPIKHRKFHSLRHTAAVRLYLKTRDIYAVMKQLGHSTVKTTEIYSRFRIEQLAQDFPDLMEQQVEMAPKTVKIANSDTEYPDTRIPALA